MRILTYILLLISFGVAAQDNSQKAKKLLDEVSAKIKTYKSISIDFRYTTKNMRENISQDSRGNVILQGDKYQTNFLGSTEIFDGQKKYTIIPEDKEVTIENYDPKKEDAFTPSKMLSFYTNGYTYSWDKLLNLSGKKIQFVKLKPTNSKSKIKEILLGIDNNTKNIYQLIQIDHDGTRSELSIISFKTNFEVPSNQFNFVENKYSDYFINRID
ncbi:MAG: outer membrane lipoprotein carrier protein LolA [Bacteroidota bacterium]|nr:outer membrane lipoprotein carrier protein LolA [Bacteroidota bacterium]